MKQVLLSDLRSILASRVMIAVAFVVLEGFVLVGAFTANESLTSTAIFVYIFAMVGILLYLVAEAGSIFLNNLRKVTYFDTMKSQGVGQKQVVLYKMLHTLIAMVVYAVVYVAALAGNLVLIGEKFPEEKAGLQGLGFREMVVGNGDPFVPALLTTAFEYLTIMVVMLALGYFAVTMTFAFFVKLRFAGMCSIFVFLTFGFVVVKANTMLYGALQGIAYHLASTGINLVCTGILLGVTFWALKTKIIGVTQEM